MSRTLPVLSMGLVLVLLAVAAGLVIRTVALPVVQMQGCLCGSGFPRWLW